MDQRIEALLRRRTKEVIAAAKEAFGPAPKCSFCDRESIRVFMPRPIRPNEDIALAILRQQLPTIYACRYHIKRATTTANKAKQDG